MNKKFQYGLIAVVVGIILLFMTGMDAISFLKAPKEIKSIYDFDTADSIKKGDHVIINVQGTIGNAASYVTYDKSTGKTKSEDNRYYILPFFSDEDSTLLTVKVSKKDFKGFEEAEDFFYESDEDFNETFITVEGIVRKLSSEEEKYVNEYCAEFDKYMGTNISIYATNLCVDLKVKSVTIIVSVIGIVLVLVGILLVALGIKQGKVDSDNRKALAASNYYQAPTNVSFNNDPNAAQAQAPQGVYNPYGIQNDPRFAGAVNQAQNAASNVTSFNEVQTGVQEAATTSFNEVQNTAQNAVNNAAAEASSLSDQIPITPITPLTPIDPIDTNNNNQ